MTDLPDDYLAYPFRAPAPQPRLDHSWFDRAVLSAPRPVAWPDGARMAVWIAVHVEHYPMDMSGYPFMPTGGMMRPYPSYWDYTSRDYGNRIGFFRLAKALDARGLTATACVNSAIAERYPRLLREIVGRGWEVAASGIDMGRLLHQALTPEEEKAIILQSIGALRAATGQPVKGWSSPAGSSTLRTLDLLAQAGIDYVCDWINDDMPFLMHTASGPVHALPLNWDRADKRIMTELGQSEAEFERQIMDAFEIFYAEATPTEGRLYSLSLSTWVSGQPFRIATIERILDRILRFSGVWVADGSQILQAWRT